MKSQKELKEKYMSIISDEVHKQDKSAQEHAKESCAYVVGLSNGDLLPIAKPQIWEFQSDSLREYGEYTQEDFKHVKGLVEKASAWRDLFIESNMGRIEGEIDRLKECLEGIKGCYSFPLYQLQPEVSIRSYSVISEKIHMKDVEESAALSGLIGVERVNRVDMAKILSGLEEVKENFRGHLDEVLEEHGLDKLNAWTCSKGEVRTYHIYNRFSGSYVGEVQMEGAKGRLAVRKSIEESGMLGKDVIILEKLTLKQQPVYQKEKEPASPRL